MCSNNVSNDVKEGRLKTIRRTLFKKLLAISAIFLALWAVGFGRYIEPSPPDLKYVSASNFSFYRYQMLDDLHLALRKILIPGLTKQEVNAIFVERAGASVVDFTYDPHTSVYHHKPDKTWRGPGSMDCSDDWGVRVFYDEEMRLKSFYPFGPC